jgi:hypothetical protein
MIRKDQNDTVSALALKYGSTTVRTLRDYYGSFAPHCADESELGEILAGLDVASLTQIIRDYKSGTLEQICQRWPDLTVSPPSCLPGGVPSSSEGTEGPSSEQPVTPTHAVHLEVGSSYMALGQNVHPPGEPARLENRDRKLQ